MEKTKTMKRPTLRDCVQIYAQYLGQTCLTNKVSYKDPAPGRLSQVGLEGEIVIDGEGGYYLCTVAEANILVKPLSKISDEDALEICKLMDYHPDNVTPDYGRELAEELNDGDMSVMMGATWWQVIAVIDYLRSKGYALPYKNWNVEELVEFGIFKLIE